MKRGRKKKVALKGGMIGWRHHGAVNSRLDNELARDSSLTQSEEAVMDENIAPIVEDMIKIIVV